MSDSRDIPKSHEDQWSPMVSMEAREYTTDVKSHSSLSTSVNDQVVLGNLIDGCGRGTGKGRARNKSEKALNKATTDIEDKPSRIHKKWTQRQVKRLHRCVELFGTDFSIISKMFPSRKRSELMNKFKKEGKKNQQGVELTLKKHESMRLSRHLIRKNSLRKESLVSVNSLDSADIVKMSLNKGLVNEVRKIIQRDDEVGDFEE